MIKESLFAAEEREAKLDKLEGASVTEEQPGPCRICTKASQTA